MFVADISDEKLTFGLVTTDEIQVEWAKASNCEIDSLLSNKDGLWCQDGLPKISWLQNEYSNVKEHSKVVITFKSTKRAWLLAALNKSVVLNTIKSLLL